MLNSLLVFLFGFFLSSQLGKHFFFSFSYFNAVRIDYLAVTIYLTDLISLFLIILNWKIILSSIKKIKLSVFLVLILTFIVLNSFFALRPMVALYRYFRFLEIFLLYILFKDRKFVRKKFVTLLLGLSLAALLNVFLGTFQIIKGKSVEGVFYLLGERSFSLATPGIAKVFIKGHSILRAYGTFSHPNSLGGFYLLLFALIYLSKRLSPVLRIFLCSLFAFLVIISFSKLAIFGLGLVFFLHALKDRLCLICILSKLLLLIFLFIFVFSYQTDFHSVSKRIFLLWESFFIFLKRPILGVGLGNYIPAKNLIHEKIKTKFLWQYREPVHNVFMLLLTEIGVVGTALLGWLVIKVSSKSWIKRNLIILILVVYLGMFDHYLLTLEQNFLLLPVLFSFEI